MLITTTNHIPGREIIEALDIARGSTVRARNLGRDIFAGLRIVLNDVQSTEVLAGTIADTDNGSRLYSVEASRRIGANWKLTLEGRVFSNIDTNDPLFNSRDDDLLQAELARYC